MVNRNTASPTYRPVFFFNGKGQCGEKLKGHVCAYEPKYRPLRAPSDKPLETKTAAVQVNLDKVPPNIGYNMKCDHHMTLARMKPSFYSHARANEADEIPKVAQKQEYKKPESELKTNDGRR
jgi:hypothetical protein